MKKRKTFWLFLVPLLVLLVSVHEGDDVDGDVVSGAQSVVGYPPAAILQLPTRPHDQVLSGHCVPVKADVINEALRSLRREARVSNSRPNIRPAVASDVALQAPEGLVGGSFQITCELKYDLINQINVAFICLLPNFINLSPFFSVTIEIHSKSTDPRTISCQ